MEDALKIIGAIIVLALIFAALAIIAWLFTLALVSGPAWGSAWGAMYAVSRGVARQEIQRMGQSGKLANFLKVKFTDSSITWSSDFQKIKDHFTVSQFSWGLVVAGIATCAVILLIYGNLNLFSWFSPNRIVDFIFAGAVAPIDPATAVVNFIFICSFCIIGLAIGSRRLKNNFSSVIDSAVTSHLHQRQPYLDTANQQYRSMLAAYEETRLCVATSGSINLTKELDDFHRDLQRTNLDVHILNERWDDFSAQMDELLKRLSMLKEKAKKFNAAQEEAEEKFNINPKMTVEIACGFMGVPTHASAEQIRSAYRDLSMKLHPDRKGSEEFMKLLNQARDYLRSIDRM